MALTFNTARPNALLNGLKQAVRDGEIVTWKLDEDGDFTHKTSSDQWTGRAWMRPTVAAGTSLGFSILHSTNATNKSLISAVYYGRFLETMLAHFSDGFSSCQYKKD
jgi:hypothetical protein